MTKLISWNLWSNNLDQVGNLQNLLKDHQPDIVCLQEVEADTILWLQKQNQYQFIQAVDYYTYKKKSKPEHYLAILSRFPITNLHSKNSFSVAHLTRGSIWERVNQWIESVEFQFADISVNGQNWRIFNVHLEVAGGPKVRFAQFQEVISRFSTSGENIVCGDFNIYARPWINFLIGWIMGFQPKEYWINERKRFNKLFKKYKLLNHFKRQVTFPLFKLQLDHILTQESRLVQSQQVIKNQYGSDHRPIRVVL